MYLSELQNRFDNKLKKLPCSPVTLADKKARCMLAAVLVVTALHCSMTC